MYQKIKHPSGSYHMTKDPSRFEPQRTNNFEVVINFKKDLTSYSNGKPINIISKNDASKSIRLAVANFSAPQANLNVLKVPYQNNIVKYAGKPDFPESSITFHDFIGLDVEEILSAWFELAYNLEKETIGSAEDYKQSAILYEYSPDGSTVRSWNLKGVWLSSYNLGEFAQDGGDVRKVTGALQYDSFRRGLKRGNEREGYTK